MALIPKDRRGQIEVVVTVAAVAVAVLGWSGLSVVGLEGYKALGLRRDSMTAEIKAITAQVNLAKRDVAEGELSRMENRLGEFQASLDLMRQLVPSTAEVPNLLDDIASRAKMRSVTLAGFTPQAVESGAPFDTQRYRVTAAGQYDQVAQFLTDIASLPRIVVPYGVHFERVQGPAADTTTQALLQASFSVRTFVKPASAADTAGAPLAGGRP